MHLGARKVRSKVTAAAPPAPAAQACLRADPLQLTKDAVRWSESSSKPAAAKRSRLLSPLLPQRSQALLGFPGADSAA